MATSNNVISLDYDMIDLSEDDKVAAQKYLNEHGVRGIEGFLAERLDAWRKWFVYLEDFLFYRRILIVFSPLNIAITGDSGAVSICFIFFLNKFMMCD